MWKLLYILTKSYNHLRKTIPVLALFSTMLFFAGSCASSTNQIQDSSSAEAYPQWYFSPPQSENMYYGIGSGSSLFQAQQKAIVNIGQQISITIEAVYTTISGTDNEEVFQSLTRQLANVRVVGSRFVDQFTDSEGLTWVLAQAPLDCILDFTEGLLLSYQFELRQEVREILTLVQQVEQSLQVQNQWLYGIGRIGPAGGVIFYENPNYENDGWRFLEAWISDLSDGYQWQTTFISIPGTSSEISSGYRNTYRVLNPTIHPAALQAQNANFGGYQDWYIPSSDELYELYLNREFVGGFSSSNAAFYWSSSEFDANSALGVLFFNGSRYEKNKGGYNRVRLIRSF